METLRKTKSNRTIGPASDSVQTMEKLALVGSLRDGKVLWRDNRNFILTTRDVARDEHGISVSLSTLPAHVAAGDAIFLNNGSIKLRVISATASELRCME